MKMGRLDEAHIDAENVLKKDPENEEGNQIYAAIEPLQKYIREAEQHVQSKNYQPAVDLLTEILEQVGGRPGRTSSAES